MLSEEEDEPASGLSEEAGAEQEIESESISNETAEFLPPNGQSQGMTREMLTLFNGAQYAGTILTGRLTGVERIPLGIVATISYNKNDGRGHGDGDRYRLQRKRRRGKMLVEMKFLICRVVVKDHSAFLCELVDKRLIICYYKHNKSMLWRTEYGIRILDFDGDFCGCVVALCRLNGIDQGLQNAAVSGTDVRETKKS